MRDKNIGFIGLGIMGESMCENIVKAGYNVNVFDLNKEQIKKLESIGAKGVNSIEEIGKKSTYIIIMVPNSDNVKDVIGSLLPGIQKDKVIIDMSTISPAVSISLAKKVEEKGGKMIDAPVVKSKAAAISGDLGILVGGDKAVLDEVKPLLECIGKNIIHLGKNGNGLVMKLCHNTLVAQIQNGVNEMILLAQKSGIDIDSFITSISYGGGQNFYLDTKGQSIKNRDFSPKFPFEHMNKDVKLTEELSKSLNLNLKGVKNVCDLYSQGMNDKLSREDFSAVYKVVEKLSQDE
jgi:3-hydroxyisobutyrate dehydrogenase-like beta-hydroxyacid dehydrogenase